MQNPQANNSSEHMLDEMGEFHIGMTLHNPKTRDLAEIFGTSQDKLRDANDKERARWRDFMRASAGQAYMDSLLDQAIRELHSRVLAANGNDHSAPALRLLFPSGLADMIRRPSREEARQAERVESFAGEAGYEAFAAEFVAVADAREALEKTLAEVAEKEAAHTRAFAAELAARQEWVLAYERNYGRLVERLGRRALADRYFRKTDRRRSHGNEQPGAPKPPIPAPAAPAGTPESPAA